MNRLALISVLLLCCAAAWADGVDWFPTHRDYVVSRADASLDARLTVSTQEAATTRGLGLEVGTGIGVMSGLQFAANLAIGLLDMPDQWPIVGGERLYVFGGTIGPSQCGGLAISIGPQTAGLRLGVPVWTSGGDPKADVAIWKATSFTLF